MADEEPQPPKLARRIIAFISTAALCGLSIGAFIKALTPENAGLLGTLTYSFAAIVLGYMGAQIAPEVFKK